MQNASRIELHPVIQRVQVHFDGMLLSDSTQALELREIGYPSRHYIPHEDARRDLLTTSKTTTHCQFKCNSVYFSLGFI